MLIYNFLENLQEDNKNKYCLIYADEKLTYGQLAEKVDVLAKKLAIKEQDKVLIKFTNPLTQLIYFLAIAKRGAICVFAPSDLPDDICEQLKQKYSIAAVLSDNELGLGNTIIDKLPTINEQTIFLGALTSGTTGLPKIILRNHKSWEGAFQAQNLIFNLSGNDKLYLAGNLSYTANLNACVHLLNEGGTVVLAENHLPKSWLNDCLTYDITAIFMVPANFRIFLKVIKEPLKNITSIFTTGAKMDIATVKKLVEYFPKANFSEYYGASELGHITYAKAQDILDKPLSVGKIFPGVKLLIKEDVVWVKSPYLAPEYQPLATVGDLGYIDSEGYLFLQGRINGLINVAGIKVIPAQVETVIKQCEGVVDVVVSGIKNTIKGEKICAWIVKSQLNLTISDIKEFCRQNMPKHCCPQKIVFIENIPINANGKIDYKQLTKTH